MTLLKKAIAPVSGLVGGLITSRTQKKQQQRQFQHSKEMSEYSYSKDLEQWHRENAYNTPEQQMQRLQEGGLNPAMIYGSGGAKTTAATSPKYQAPKVPNYDWAPPINPMNMLNQYQDWRVKNAQIDNVQEQTQLIKMREQVANNEMLFGNIKLHGKGYDSGNYVTDTKNKVKTFIKDSPYYKKYMESQGKYQYEIDKIDSQNKLMQKELEQWMNKHIWVPLGRTVISTVGGMVGKATPSVTHKKTTRNINLNKR